MAFVGTKDFGAGELDTSVLMTCEGGWSRSQKNFFFMPQARAWLVI